MRIEDALVGMRDRGEIWGYGEGEFQHRIRGGVLEYLHSTGTWVVDDSPLNELCWNNWEKRVEPLTDKKKLDIAVDALEELSDADTSNYLTSIRAIKALKKIRGEK